MKIIEYSKMKEKKSAKCNNEENSNRNDKNDNTGSLQSVSKEQKPITHPNDTMDIQTSQSTCIGSESMEIIDENTIQSDPLECQSPCENLFVAKPQSLLRSNAPCNVVAKDVILESNFNEAYC